MTSDTATSTRTEPGIRSGGVDASVLDRVAAKAVENRRSLTQEVSYRLERTLTEDAGRSWDADSE